jgi:xylulokinase
MAANKEESLFLGVDVGTSGTKVVLFDARGGVLTRTHQTYPLYHPAPGFFELDPEEVWTAVASCLQRIGLAYSNSPIKALAISVQGEAVIPVDKQGRPLARSPVSADMRGASYLRQLGKRLDPLQLSRTTGQPLSPLASLTKILWWREQRPNLFEQTQKFYCYGEFILSRLGVEPAIDESMASRTMAYDIRRKLWSAEVLYQADLDSSRFAPVLPSGTIVGKMPDTIARDLSLPLGIEIVVGGHDQACAAFGAGVIDSQTSLYSIGTTEVIAAVFDTPSNSLLEKNVPCYPHVVPGKYVALIGSQTGARLLEWFAETFVRMTDASDRLSAAAIQKLTERVDDDPGDLMLLPYFAGSGSVRNDPAAKGALIGLTFETRFEDIVKALLEGITYEQADSLFHVPEIDEKVKTFRSSGGGARSATWLRIKANILGRPFETLEVEDTACLGAALIAGCGIGVFDSPEAAAAQVVRRRQRFEPDPKKHRQYRRKLELYGRLANQFARPITVNGRI